MKKVLMLGHVASMIDHFCIPNIELLAEMGCEVHAAANFIQGYASSPERIKALTDKLDGMGITHHQIDFARNPLRLIKLIRAYRELLLLMRRERYDMVHSNGPVSGILGRIVCAKLGIKSIYTAHGFHFYKGCSPIRWVLYYTAEKYCAAKTDILVTMNSEDYDIASRRFKARKTVYVPGVGMNLTDFSPFSEEKRQEIKRNNSIPDDKKWLLCVGELTKRKNHTPLILAVADMPDVYLTIAGVGALKNRLTGLIEELGACERVKLLGFRDDIAELTGACDCFVFPSLQEGLPAAVMEAMAAGRPIALSRIRGNVDLVTEGEGGCFFEPCDPDSIKAAIEGVFASNRDAMGRTNRENMAKFSIDAVLPLYRQWYGELLG